MKKRFFAIVLCLVLCVSMFPIFALAEEGEPCEHQIVAVPEGKTCGSPYRAHFRCTVCGALFEDKDGNNPTTRDALRIAALNHDKVALVHKDPISPTCTAVGSKEYWSCPTCGQKFAENNRSKPVTDQALVIPALPHTIDPASWQAPVAHTCTQDGTVGYYTCSGCGQRFADLDGETPLTSIVDPARHQLTEHPAVDATCTTDGNRKYYSCDICGLFFDEDKNETVQDSWVIRGGHQYVGHPAADPSCTADGNKFYYSCDRCGKVYDENFEEITPESVNIARLPHRTAGNHVDAVSATCTTDGNIEYWWCEGCGGCFADAEGTAALDSVLVPASHDFETTEAKAATCTEDGNIAYRTCRVCGIIVDEDGNPVELSETVIGKTGHTLEKQEASVSCTAGMAEHYKCTICGALFLDEEGTVAVTAEELETEAPGHDYAWDGLCTRCGALSPDAPAFQPDPVVFANGIVVSVSAPEGVFPAGSELSVVKVPVTQAEGAVEAEREAGATVVVSFTFDIKVLKNGEEIQPADGSLVNVSFSLAEAKNENLNAQVYHVTEEGAEALSTSVAGETISAVTDGFSLYTVELTYSELQYVMNGGESVPLTTVLETLNLKGSVESVSVSNPLLFTVEEEGGEWMVNSLQAFQTEEWMKVTLDGVVYNIKVTDATVAGLGADANTSAKSDADTTKPVIAEITLNKTTLKADGEEYVEVAMKVTDDKSGVDYGYICFKEENTGKELFTYLSSSFTVTHKNGIRGIAACAPGEIGGVIFADQYLPSGRYIIVSAVAYDKAGNNTETIPDDAHNLYIDVTNQTSADPTKHVINEINLDKTTLEAGGEDYVTVTLTMTDEGSGINLGSIYFTDEKSGRTISTDLKSEYYIKDKNGKQEKKTCTNGQIGGVIYAGQYLPGGRYKISSLYASDKADKIIRSIPDAAKGLYIDVTNPTGADTTEPVITEIKLHKKTLETGGKDYVIVTMTVTDDKSGAEHGSISFEDENTGKRIYASLTSDSYTIYENGKEKEVPCPEGKLCGTIIASSSMPSGRYKIVNAKTFDKAGNHTNTIPDASRALYIDVTNKASSTDSEVEEEATNRTPTVKTTKLENASLLATARVKLDALCWDKGKTNKDAALAVYEVKAYWSDGTPMTAAELKANPVTFTLPAPEKTSSTTHTYEIWHYDGEAFTEKISSSLTAKDVTEMSPFAVFAIPTADKTTPLAPEVSAASIIDDGSTQEGRIVGATTAMEYRKEGVTTWTYVESNPLIIKTAGTYYIRYYETATTFASPATKVEIEAWYTVTAKLLSGKGSYEAYAPHLEYKDDVYLVKKGDKIAFKFTPATGYILYEINVNDKYVGQANVKTNYTLSDVDKKTVVSFSFSNSSKSPKTGDDSNVVLWGAVAAVSLIAVAALVFFLSKKKKKK